MLIAARSCLSAAPLARRISGDLSLMDGSLDDGEHSRSETRLFGQGW